MGMLLERFSGTDGQRRLIEALRRQPILEGLQTAVEEIASIAVLEENAAGTTIIRQDGTDNDVYFLLVGTVGIVINGREIAQRVAGQHVGEMALIDPSARRSATVIAKTEIVTARVSESKFGAIGNANPQIWRRIAVEIAQRLRQRTTYIKLPNSKPHIFIGSSVEALDIAREIQLGLKHDPFSVFVWTDGIFSASKTTIEALESELSQADFAVLVLGPDDELLVRGELTKAPRDNLIFELGLFMGALTCDRTYIARPQGVAIKLPTDVLGTTPLTYSPDKSIPLGSRIAPLCTEIRKLVIEKGPR